MKIETDDKVSRLMLARGVANELLDDLEMGTSSISNCIMKAKRLARLLRDTDAQLWLDYEMRGYPKTFYVSMLNSCEKYAIQGGRVTEEGTYWLLGLPQIEAYSKSNEVAMQGLRFPGSISPSVSSSNPHEYTGNHLTNAVTAVTNGYISHANTIKNEYVKYVQLYNSLKSSIHNYVTDKHISLTLGDIAENIFEEARDKVDRFVSSNCPKAAEQLIAVNDRILEGTEEAFAEALTTCRRMLFTIADAVFPSRSEPYVDGKGTERKVGTEQYKNRLMAYIEQKTKSSSSNQIVSTQIEHLASRLDAVYEKVCKGVHADVDRDEALLSIINTYLVIAEIAK